MGRSSERPEEKKIVKRLPYYANFDYARIGYFSLTTKDTKFISEDDALTIEGVTETPGYFFGKFMKGLWVAKQKIAQADLSYPYKAKPGKEPYALYIDISRAFRQIAYAFGAEVFVHEGRMVAYGETLPTGDAFENKIVRGLLVTGTQPKGSYQEWIKDDLRTVRFSNPNYAPHLSYTIWSVLHAIQSVLSPYTLYGHTDGFIVPARHCQKAFAILNEYGFNYSIKGEGITEIYGVGSYRVGSTRTRSQLHPDKSRVYVRDDNAEWWLNKYREGVDLRGGINPDDLFGGTTPIDSR